MTSPAAPDALPDATIDAEPDAAPDSASDALPVAPLLAYAAPRTAVLISRPHLPELPIESRAKRVTFLLIAVLLTLAYGLTVAGFWSPSHPGTDQNGYLVGGKMFADNLTMLQQPRQLRRPDLFDPHAYVASMWVTAAGDAHNFYPKYPLGLPFIYACCLWVGAAVGPLFGGSLRDQLGPVLAYAVSPVMMTGAVLGVFFLVRQFAGSFAGTAAMLVFATSPTTGSLVINPNSHATTVFCVVWGMICLLHWWRCGGKRWAVAAGFLVGYAATIRYTEAALILPLLWAAVVRLRLRRWRSWLESALVPIGWAVPIGILLAYNLAAMGTLTGYDATNESTGFSWNFFYDNWETIVRQLTVNGLFLVMPLAIVGLIAMFWWNWRIAIFVWLWTLPCLTIYTFYYWAPDGVGYLRFVLTILPPMLIGGYWLIAHLRDVLPSEPPRLPIYLMLLVLTTAGLAVAAAGYFGLRFDLETHKLASVHDYLQQPASAFQRLGGWPAFVASIVMLGALGAAVSASAFLRRSIVPTLAAGVVTLLSVAVQADDSASFWERDRYDRCLLESTANEVKRLVPDGAVLICREEGIDNYLQFVTNDRLYSGLSFDRNWVNGRPQAATQDPVLIDPVRGQQLIDALKGFDQNALNDQARMLVSNALLSKRRVFVLEPLNAAEMLKATKEKKDGPVPEFVRRYIVRPKDQSLIGKRLTWWQVPIPVKDDVKPPFRGRRDGRPAYRVACYQLWEITSKA